MGRTQRAVTTIVVATAAIAVLNCGWPVTAVQPSNVLVSLTIGNQWTYATADSLRGVGVTPTVGPESTYTLRLVRDTIDASQVDWGVIETHLAPSDSLIATTYESNNGDGLFKMIPSTNTRIMVYPYPAVLSQVDTTAMILDGPLRLALFDTVVTVPAGTFHCIKYEYVTVPGTAVDPYQSVYIGLGTGIVLKVRRVEAAFDANGKLTGHQDHMQILMSTTAH